MDQPLKTLHALLKTNARSKLFRHLFWDKLKVPSELYNFIYFSLSKDELFLSRKTRPRVFITMVMKKMCCFAKFTCWIYGTLDCMLLHVGFKLIDYRKKCDMNEGLVSALLPKKMNVRLQNVDLIILRSHHNNMIGYVECGYNFVRMNSDARSVFFCDKFTFKYEKMIFTTEYYLRLASRHISQNTTLLNYRALNARNIHEFEQFTGFCCQL